MNSWISSDHDDSFKLNRREWIDRRPKYRRLKAQSSKLKAQSSKLKAQSSKLIPLLPSLEKAGGRGLTGKVYYEGRKSFF
jgi:hypothetical protein